MERSQLRPGFEVHTSPEPGARKGFKVHTSPGATQGSDGGVPPLRKKGACTMAKLSLHAAESEFAMISCDFCVGREGKREDGYVGRK